MTTCSGSHDGQPPQHCERGGDGLRRGRHDWNGWRETSFGDRPVIAARFAMTCTTARMPTSSSERAFPSMPIESALRSRTVVNRLWPTPSVSRRVRGPGDVGTREDTLAKRPAGACLWPQRSLRFYLRAALVRFPFHRCRPLCQATGQRGIAQGPDPRKIASWRSARKWAGRLFWRLVDRHFALKSVAHRARAAAFEHE